jgi:hypothetical protein
MLIGERGLARMPDSFFAALPAFDRFDRVVDDTLYHPLPGDWVLAVADIVGSTEAIGAGRYKTVNFVGAAPIAAVRNATGEPDLPFVFAGDGSLVALPPGGLEAAGAALAATRAWAAREFGLELRTGLVSLGEVRASGHDVRVARFQASATVSYAMIAGGGAAWADRELKAGRLPCPTAPADAMPDLSDLSCRWQPLRSRRGVMLSVLVEPAPGTAPSAAASVYADLLARIAALADGGRPVPAAGPGFRWPPPAEAVELEARAGGPDRDPPDRRRKAIRRITAIARVLQILGLKAGGFDARHYRKVTGQNADFRKFEDGLRLTLDCAPADAAALEALLAAAGEAGTVRYGLHRQDAAMMTCIVADPRQDDHVHFIDGADGGYARAAQAMKGA